MEIPITFDSTTPERAVAAIQYAFLLGGHLVAEPPTNVRDGATHKIEVPNERRENMLAFLELYNYRVHKT